MRKLAAVLFLLALPSLAQERNPLTRGLADTLYVKLAGSDTVLGTVTFTNLTVTGTCTGCTAGGGTVTTASVVPANGFAGTVANPTTTPAITLSTSITGVLKGNGTAISAAGAGTDYVVPGGALGTPSSGTLTNATGLPIGGVSGLATGIATFLGSATSANLAAALTDKTGTGLAVFATSPSFGTSIDVAASGITATGLPAARVLTILGSTSIVSGHAIVAGKEAAAYGFGAIDYGYITAAGAYTQLFGVGGQVNDTSSIGSRNFFVFDYILNSTLFKIQPTIATFTVPLVATTFNKLTITQPTTASTLTVADGKTLTAPNDATVSGTNTGDQTITATGDVTSGGCTGSCAMTVSTVLGGSTPVITTRSISTTAPVTGGGNLSADRTIACATCATTTNGGALSATSPATISVAGVIACATCATTTNGGALSATSPVTISVAGVIACATCSTTTGANTALSNLASVAINADLVTGAGTAANFTATAPAAAASTTAGTVASVTASAATAGTTNAGAAAGGAVTITSGAAARLTSGNANGGNINLNTGAGIGTGTQGVVLANATYQSSATLAYSFSAETNTGILRDGGIAGMDFRVGGTDICNMYMVNSTNAGFRCIPGASFNWSSSGLGSIDTSLTRLAAGVVAAGTTGASGGTTGWFVDAGHCFVTADQTNATATAQTTTCSMSLTTGRKYSFTCEMFLSDSVAADGAVLDFNGGSATSTNFRAQVTAFDTALNVSTILTSLAGTATATTFTGAGAFEIHGSFEPSGTGTFIPRFSQSAHTTGTLTLARGSYCKITDMP